MAATPNAQGQCPPAAAAAHRDDLFSSLISDIKTYSGKDLLLPWLRGIKTMKECLPAHLLKEKLPRFLQKCTRTFESNQRYKNDLRYLRVWLELMDYVDEPKLLLKAMETNHIGTKRSLFYQAYALYYEKAKKYEEAEKMYHMGVQNLAEPIDDLKKSYQQFLHRMERHKDKKSQPHERKFGKKPLSRLNPHQNKENTSRAEIESKEAHRKDYPNQVLTENKKAEATKILKEKPKNVKPLTEDNGKLEGGDDTVVATFVDTAIVGKPQAEDARHHGLVEPTVNMKEAINAINSMFSEPMEILPLKGKGTNCNRQKEYQSSNSGSTVFIDEDSDEKDELIQPRQRPLEIYMDNKENWVGRDEGDSLENSVSSAFVFPWPKDLPPEGSDELGNATSSRGKFREDTVVCRFVGSAILDDPVAENVCHHGLVDPTINLKEAMQDINSMFGKPIDFVRTKRSKKNERLPQEKGDRGGFLILPDDDNDDVDDEHEHGQSQVLPDLSTKAQNKGTVELSILPDDELELTGRKLQPESSGKSRGSDLFEPTLYTKEAMDDINKMFGMPLDF
ncbi:probable inactive serine/threonine-protein kinase bub1 [Punica granatum]|uniref:Probable inactive serine/threonine-protein kinase bub1 n=1 Tax=Punica granatum TaxID=22663 RepID=A0A6P8BNM1_PUNGR|nr:probable inactive serine/threonine-protein kinase bub1 [Punica granatum]